MKTYNCQECGKESIFGHSKKNKFCSKSCQDNWHWVNTKIPEIEKGIVNNPRSLKKYLIEKFGENCFDCGLGNTWQNKTLTLQLEHTDGNSDNNFPNNLKLCCPNCHSQTEFFGSKGQGNRYKKITKRNAYLREYKASIAQG